MFFSEMSYQIKRRENKLGKNWFEEKFTMNKFRFMFQILVVLFAASVYSEAAPQAFVSSGGNDANSCARSQPCRTFAVATAAVDAGGEIIVLDSGSYGAVTITKALSIIAPDGIYAGITAVNAIVVAAGANDTVVLRGLTLSGPNFGVNFDSGAALHIENCVINNFSRGVLFDAPGKLFVSDTIVQKNFVGIQIASANGIQASIERVRAINNTSLGVYVGGNSPIRLSVADSVLSGNTFDGLLMASGKATVTRTTAANNGRHGFALESGVATEAMFEDCAATGNGDTGFLSSGGANVVVRVSDSTATDNATGFKQLTYAVFQSYGNNRVRTNTANTSGSIQITGGN